MTSETLIKAFLRQTSEGTQTLEAAGVILKTVLKANDKFIIEIRVK